MESIIEFTNVGLTYRTNESLSIKKVLKSMVFREKKVLVNEYKALDGINLTIEKGKVYGIIGNNGAGKSTLLKVLSGIISPNEGTVTRNYKTINLLALGVGFSKDISGLDNIMLNGLLLGFTKKQINEKLDDIISYSELGEFIYKPMKTYSSGMVSRLGFSVAINLKPQVLLIDEVLSVGDVKFRKKSFESIKKLIQDREVTVVIVSHSESQLRELCDQVIWIEKGKLIESGDKNEVIEKYLNYI
ncbi:MAG: ABC transporter ATP-binding protein [Peptostreptococcaceae bacterium]